MFMDEFEFTKHQYTFASNDDSIKFRVFWSRQDATKHMYKICHKKGLNIDHILDDKHYKTYVCDNGVRFYINRV